MTVEQILASLKLQVKPRHNFVYVLPLMKSATSGRIIQIEDSKREALDTGLIVALGPGLLTPETGRWVPVTLRLGEIGHYGRFAGMETVVMAPGGPVPAISVRDTEVLGHEEPGTFELVVHSNADGPDLSKMHKAGLRCDLCKTVQEEERERLRAEGLGGFHQAAPDALSSER